MCLGGFHLQKYTAYHGTFYAFGGKIGGTKSSPHTALKGAKTQCMGSTKESNRRYRLVMSQTYPKKDRKAGLYVVLVDIFQIGGYGAVEQLDGIYDRVQALLLRRFFYKALHVS